ncbi:unnamed protein product, partial [Vitis vinifera]
MLRWIPTCLSYGYLKINGDHYFIFMSLSQCLVVHTPLIVLEHVADMPFSSFQW